MLLFNCGETQSSDWPQFPLLLSPSQALGLQVYTIQPLVAVTCSLLTSLPMLVTQAGLSLWSSSLGLRVLGLYVSTFTLTLLFMEFMVLAQLDIHIDWSRGWEVVRTIKCMWVQSSNLTGKLSMLVCICYSSTGVGKYRYEGLLGGGKWWVLFRAHWLAWLKKLGGKR